MKQLFIAQMLAMLVLAAVWGAINHHAFWSVLLGGIACVLPNFFFAKYFFSRQHTRRPGQILLVFYLGEFLKLIISALVIVLAIIYLNLLILPTILGYFVANLGFWMAPMFVLKQAARSA